MIWRRTSPLAAQLAEISQVVQEAAAAMPNLPADAHG